MVFIAVGVGFFYLITTTIGDIQKEDEVFQNSDYKKEHKYDQYITTDSIGEEILDVTLADSKMQIEAWNHSDIKQEFIDLFPDFDTMRTFVKNRVRGDVLVKKLTDQIKKVEDAFFSGTMNAEQAKRVLKQLK
ncbi:hypothetical protein MNB_SV-4-882 [hydrothermal vent metagenome]|uniref:Uncharacterized protein n=1 Tax=hydrothermal vent metagenome TaxID=652676 RepID=A0A1W1E9L9_9ZZZZ